jgi:hypothetical protein
MARIHFSSIPGRCFARRIEFLLFQGQGRYREGTLAGSSATPNPRRLGPIQSVAEKGARGKGPEKDCQPAGTLHRGLFISGCFCEIRNF